MARPTKYTKKICDEICKRLTLGETLIAICKDKSLPSQATVNKWLIGTYTKSISDKSVEEFRKAYEQAREKQADHWADQIVEISDDDSNDVFMVEVTDKNGNVRKEARVSHAAANRAKLRCDVRQWLMTRRNKKYVELHKQEVSGLSDIIPVINLTIKAKKDDEN